VQNLVTATVKINNMKKLLFAVFVAGLMASCSNSASPEADIKDSLDSVAILKKESIDEAAANAKDTIEQRTDSLKEVIDSVADQTRDSLHK